MTFGATHARLVILTGHVLFADRHPAAMTLVVTAFVQIMVDSDPFIEYKAFTLPPGLRHRDRFEILQDTASKMIYGFETVLFQECGGFFTTYAASTVHCDFFVLFRIEIFQCELRKFPEICRMRVNRIFKVPHFDLVFVAGVHQKRFGVFHQRIPVFRINVSSRQVRRVNAVDTHGDNFIFQFDPGAFEWQLVCS